ncbi:hypothetical protein [Alkalihalobacillus sp. CinArs1]|uniref:hypothetical protein n=1 Tax=Alkalihalobacillus sp. CinArs1 TaxID=2995314 RepID=UPI0022DE7D5C|nr:hypothetical protein [Alkalihalobacillus sp. CinArs1]
MDQDKLRAALILGSLVGLIGIIMLFFSVDFGTEIAENWLAEEGGANMEYYHIAVQGFINNFIVAGGIMFAFGLIVTSVALYFR